MTTSEVTAEETVKRVKILLSEFTRRQERATGIFDSQRQTLAQDLMREGGPSWESCHGETSWKKAREEMRVCKDIVEALQYALGEKGK